LGDAQQGKPLQAHGVDDRLEIADPHVGGRLAGGRVREPAAPLVVPDEGVPLTMGTALEGH
jgi:hypothetical protein